MEQPIEGQPVPEEQPQEGGGVEEALTQADQALSALAEGVVQSPDVPDEIKQGFASLHEQFTVLAEQLVSGAQPQPEASAPQSVEQGGNPNAQPLPPGAA